MANEFREAAREMYEAAMESWRVDGFDKLNMIDVLARAMELACEEAQHDANGTADEYFLCDEIGFDLPTKEQVAARVKGRIEQNG